MECGGSYGRDYGGEEEGKGCSERISGGKVEVKGKQVCGGERRKGDEGKWR